MGERFKRKRSPIIPGDLGTVLYDIPLTPRARTSSEDNHDAAEPAALDETRPTCGDHSSKVLSVESRLTSHTLAAASVAAVGGLLFGYDIGVISGALLQLQTDFALSCAERERVVSFMLIGACVSSAICGYVVDLFGRKLSIIFNSIVFVVGSIVLAAAQGLTTLLCGRFIIGFAVAFSVMAECVYIGEIAPAKHRGKLVSLTEICIAVGFLMAYFVNYLLIDTPGGWRIMFAVSIVPAVVQLIAMVFMPCSPRFLLQRGQLTRAEAVLRRLNEKTDVSAEIALIVAGLEKERCTSVFNLCSADDSMRLRTLVAVLLVLLQQASGQPTVLYYAPIILESMGFHKHDASTLATTIFGSLKILATLCSMLLIDRVGGKRLLLCGSFVMALSIGCLGALSTGLSNQFSQTPCSDYLHGNRSKLDDVLNSTTTTSQFPSRLGSAGNSTGLDGPVSSEPLTRILVVSFLGLYIAMYSVGFGPVTWVVLSELFPTAIRGRAVAFATLCNWAANFLVSFTFLDLATAIGIGPTFIIYSLICLLSFFCIFLLIPETNGRSLEKLQDILSQYRLSHRLRRFFSLFQRSRTAKSTAESDGDYLVFDDSNSAL